MLKETHPRLLYFFHVFRIVFEFFELFLWVLNCLKLPLKKGGVGKMNYPGLQSGVVHWKSFVAIAGRLLLKE
jgi:hypothetical protein